MLFHCIYVSHFLHLSTGGHLACFHLLTVMNNTAINIGVQVRVQVLGLNSIGLCLKVELLDCMVICVGVCNIVQEAVIKTIPKGKKMQEGKVVV